MNTPTKGAFAHPVLNFVLRTMYATNASHSIRLHERGFRAECSRALNVRMPKKVRTPS